MRPVEPPHTSTAPAANFVDSRPRAGIPATTALVISPTDGLTGAPGRIPISITSTCPAWSLPGEIHRPGLAAWKVAVASARTAAPATSPVEASTPLGTSQAITTGRSGPPGPPPAAGSLAASIASIAPFAGSRGSPEKPVPRIASMIAAAPASRPA